MTDHLDLPLILTVSPFLMYSAGSSLTLEVLNSEKNIIEGARGQESAVSFCFRSEIPQPLMNIVTFGLIVSNNDTTSTIGVEFYPNVTVTDFIIPIGFSGIFMQCIDIVVVGDNMVEENEVIVYDIVSFSGRGIVRFPGNADSLVINVQDDDGEIFLYPVFVLFFCGWTPCNLTFLLLFGASDQARL